MRTVEHTYFKLEDSLGVCVFLVYANRLLLNGFFYPVLFIILAACNNDPGALPEIQAQKIGSREDFGKGWYFQDILDIEKFGDSLYFFLDGSANKIFCTDNKLQYLYSFVQEGKAPYEAVGLQSMALSQDTLFVTDVSAGKIMMFDTRGVFAGSFNTGPLGIGDFCTTPGEVMIYADDEPPPRLLVINKRSLRPTYLPLADHGLEQPDRHVLYPGNKTIIVVTAENRPVVEIYNLQGRLQQKIDLSYLKLFETTLTYYEKEIKNNPQADLVLIPDVAYCNHHLYLLVSYLDQNQEWHSNAIIACQISEQDIRPERIITLADRWYEALLVDGSQRQILAANGQDVLLETYLLP